MDSYHDESQAKSGSGRSCQTAVIQELLRQGLLLAAVGQELPFLESYIKVRPLRPESEPATRNGPSRCLAGIARTAQHALLNVGAYPVGATVEIRGLARNELVRVGEIDRTERIDVLFEQHGTQLVARRGNWNSPAWDVDGQGAHSVDAQRQALLHYVDAGGVALGAFSNGRLVGIGAVVPHIRPAIARLTYLHVSQDFRSAGVGSHLCADLELIARRAGDTEIVVTATPSENTVRFYLGRGYRPMAMPLPELVELEPDDIHMGKVL
jgi:GNAT superfamily N-acetyltransferase